MAAEWEQPVTTAARSVGLSAGFNLVTWTGASGTPVAAALAGLGGALDVSFTYDAVAASFATYGPSLLPLLNTAGPLGYGEGVWVRVTEAVRWDQPAPPPGQTVVSGDGGATVSVAVGIGPVGAVSVEALALEGVAASGVGREVLAAYRLSAPVLEAEPASEGLAGQQIDVQPGDPGIPFEPRNSILLDVELPDLRVPLTQDSLRFMDLPLLDAITPGADGAAVSLEAGMTVLADGTVRVQVDASAGAWVFDPARQAWDQEISIERLTELVNDSPAVMDWEIRDGGTADTRIALVTLRDPSLPDAVQLGQVVRLVVRGAVPAPTRQLTFVIESVTSFEVEVDCAAGDAAGAELRFPGLPAPFLPLTLQIPGVCPPVEPDGPLDFGDAPDSYGTLRESDGARHLVEEGFALSDLAALIALTAGARAGVLDAEADGQPSVGAMLDDTDWIEDGSKGDDEEGVTWTGDASPGGTIRFGVSVTRPGVVAIWIDVNQNGVFDDFELLPEFPREVELLQPVSGELTLPADGMVGPGFYARVRLYKPGFLGEPVERARAQPRGYGGAGEVEDYRLRAAPEDHSVTATARFTSGRRVGPDCTSPVLPAFVDQLVITVSDGFVEIRQPSTGDVSMGFVTPDGSLFASGSNGEQYLGMYLGDWSFWGENLYPIAGGGDCRWIWTVHFEP